MLHAIPSNAYEKVAQELMEQNPELAYIRVSNCRIAYLVSDQVKTKNRMPVLAETEIIPDKYKWGLNADIAITIYTLNCADFNEEQRKILLFQQLLKVVIDFDEASGEESYKIREYDVNDFEIIIKKYGVNWKETQKTLFED